MQELEQQGVEHLSGLGSMVVKRAASEEAHPAGPARKVVKKTAVPSTGISKEAQVKDGVWPEPLRKEVKKARVGDYGLDSGELVGTTQHSFGEPGEKSLRKNAAASGYKGVTQHRSKWKAQVRKDGKLQHLGSFTTKEEAAEAVKQYEITGVKELPGHKTGSSGFKGVYKQGNRWQAQVSKEGKQHYLGTFDTAELAAKAVENFELTGEKTPTAGPKQAASGFKCVYARGNRWQAQVRKDGKNHHLGHFDTAEEANAAVQEYTARTSTESSSTSLTNVLAGANSNLTGITAAAVVPPMPTAVQIPLPTVPTTVAEALHKQ